jgi:hypothetical protein
MSRDTLKEIVRRAYRLVTSQTESDKSSCCETIASKEKLDLITPAPCSEQESAQSDENMKRLG